MDPVAGNILFYTVTIGIMLLLYRYSKYAFGMLLGLWTYLGVVVYLSFGLDTLLQVTLYHILPLTVLNLLCFLVWDGFPSNSIPKQYKVRLGSFTIQNMQRGVSIIGSSGSGKTESVVHSLLKHLNRYQFPGVIHDYKHFEITEMAYPMFNDSKIPFHIVSFDDIHKKVNPIAPRYLPDAESVNEISRVLLENLLEQRESVAYGSSKFFNDAVEGLLGGLIWKLKTEFPEQCTLPHLMATFQYLKREQLMAFLESDFTSKAMADAFLSGVESERQTAGVMSTLANALKKISTERIFMALSADEVPWTSTIPKTPQ